MGTAARNVRGLKECMGTAARNIRCQRNSQKECMKSAVGYAREIKDSLGLAIRCFRDIKRIHGNSCPKSIKNIH